MKKVVKKKAVLLPKAAKKSIKEVKSDKKVKLGPFGRPIDPNAKKKKKVVKKNPLPVWKSPSDFKPFDLEVKFKTEKDGLPGSNIKAIRYKGRFNAKAEDKNKFDMAEYDVPTLLGIQARLAMVLFHPTGRPTSKGIATRLPGNTVYRVLYRVGKRKADDALSAKVKTVWRAEKTKKGTFKAVEITDKKDAELRKIRKTNRYMAAAFRECLMPPKKSRKRREEADDE
mgnify:CR=1 FL=1